MKRGGRGLTVFARTFLLLALALLLMQGVALLLVYVYPPKRMPSIEMPQVVALLSSQMPSDDERLRVTTTDDAPALPADGEYRDDPWVREVLARWLGTDIDRIRFYSRPLQPDLQRQGIPPPPPPPVVMGGEFPPMPETGPDAGLFRAPPAAAMRPRDRLLFGPQDDFIVAVRRSDGRWQVVEYDGGVRPERIGREFGLLGGIGLLVMLPLAWWFARTLSAQIARFAQAADEMGHDPNGAAPLPSDGPYEIRRAAESFNAMQTRLNRLLRERTNMAGAIAHDLRTPLARLAFRLHEVPFRTDLRQRAMADIEEMEAMISAALEFIRDSGRVRERERLDFRQLVESVTDDFADTGRPVTLQPGAAVLLDGDPLALRRVLLNLIGNALKYGKCARLSLAIADGRCRLWIDDDGPGVDPAQHEQLFTPFFRGETSRNRDTGGIGLGLAIARDVVLAHCGEICLHNRPEGGLRVTVILPLTATADKTA